MFRAVLNDCFCKNLSNPSRSFSAAQTAWEVQHSFFRNELMMKTDMVYVTSALLFFWKWKHLEHYFFKNCKAFNNGTSLESAFLKPIYSQPLKFPLKKVLLKKRSPLSCRDREVLKSRANLSLTIIEHVVL